MACYTLLMPTWLSAQSNTSVLAYGAVADGILRTDGTMLAGSAVLTSPSATFTSADVGKYVQVIGAGPGSTSNNDGVMNASSPVLNSASGTFASSDIGRGIVIIGAGPGGANLVTTILAYNSPSSVVLTSAAQSSVSQATYYYGAMTLEGTIQSVQNGTAVTLSTPALATISGATYAYGTDSHAAFQAALDAVGQAGGGTVSVPAPTACPGGAVCGYVVKASDQMTSVAPGAVKIRYNNVSLTGAAPQTNLFCRGAYGIYTNSPAFPGTTGIIRGFCLNVGDNGGPNGAAGEAVSNVTIANLHLYGMTNGNTFRVNFGYPLNTPSGDGWDITHKAIYMWGNSTFSNITINSTVIQDFKAENIYSGGSVITGMVISNSTLENYNGDGISMEAADLQVLNNTISNGSNAAVEDSTVSAGAGALVRQLYQGNTISQTEREGIVVVGVDGGVASGSVQITNNYFDTIGQINGAGTQAAIYIASQNNYVPPANVTVTGNTCHDCYSFGVFVTSGNSVVQGNTFTVDRYNACCVLPFMYSLTGLTIANNTGSLTSYAQATGLSMGAVYMINPGYATGGFAWKNVVLKGNSWTFAGTPQYEFVTTSGLGWQLVTLDNLNWQGDVCNGCTHADVNHGLVNLAQTTTIEPYGPTVYVNGNSSTVTATVDAQKQEDGSQIQIVNAGAMAVLFASDNNLSLASPITLPGGSNSSVNFVYHASLGKWTSGSSTAASIAATAGTPQSATVNTAFATALQGTVKDAGGNPLSGVTVTFTAPGSGASATFSGSASATAVTNTSGVATAPALTANGQAGSYTVTASVAGVATPASFSLTNVAGSPASVAATAGTPQSATVNTAFAALQGTVKDTGGNPLSGVTVTFTAPGSGASAAFSGSASATAVTNTSGVATAPALTANGQAGSYTVTASVAGVATPASFSLTNVAGSPASVAATAGTPQSATVNTAFAALQGTVKDTGGNPLSGVTVTFTAPGSGASATFSGSASATAVTNTSGVATAPALTANGQAGSYTVTASVAGVATPASFSLTNVAGSPASVAATAGTPQSATVNTAFAALQGTVKDTGGNPLSGVTVTFTAPGSGASATFSGSASATAVTNTSGVATAPALTANGQAGSYTVTASVAGVATPASFSLTNMAAASGGGGLTGSANSLSSAANLTQEGTSDWVHWGDTALNRKSGVTAQISNYAVAGAGQVSTYNNDPRILSWSDGTPLASATDPNGVYINFPGNGFTLTVPADTTARTLTVHVGGWLSGGTLTAHLSDGSAADYVDTTAAAGGQYDRNYVLTYNAATAGQTLRVSWVMTSGSGNVTLAGAALSMAGSSGASASIAATAGTPQSATVNTAFATALRATVKDANGNPLSGVRVMFAAPASGASGTFGASASATAATNSSGVAKAPVLTANGQTGSYRVTASVAGVATPASFSLNNTAAATGGGSLTGSGNSASTAVNLTQEGTSDWVHWGDTALNRKSGVTAQISNYAVAGAGQVSTYNNDPRILSWSDGTPLASATDPNGVYINFPGNGFTLTVPADTTARTLTVHVGGWLSGGTLTAHLSDDSAADYVDTTAAAGGQYDRNYVLTYNAATAGQTLKLSWVMTSGTGNVTLSGAALH